MATQPLRLEVITGPAVEPFTVEEVREHLLDTRDEQTHTIRQLIIAAREMVEKHINRALITQTLKLTVDNFRDEIRLPSPPLQSVSSVKYLDQDEVEQTVSSSLYTVDTSCQPGRVLLGYGDSWPSDWIVYSNAVRITYVAGYGSTSALIPLPIKRAMLLWIGSMYENRQMVEYGMNTSGGFLELPRGYNTMLAPYRVHTRWA